MPSISRATLGQLRVAICVMVLLAVALGSLYPLPVTGIGQPTMPAKANGSDVRDERGAVVGSLLIGQSFLDSNGNPLTQWFRSRPSAAGDGYDADASSGGDLGSENSDLAASIRHRKHVIEKTYGVTASQIPTDAVTASGSGLDPDISPAYAALQVRTVADPADSMLRSSSGSSQRTCTSVRSDTSAALS